MATGKLKYICLGFSFPPTDGYGSGRGFGDGYNGYGGGPGGEFASVCIFVFFSHLELFIHSLIHVKHSKCHRYFVGFKKHTQLLAHSILDMGNCMVMS